MAISFIESQTADNGGATSVTPTAISGHQNNDFLIAFCMASVAGGGITWSTPTGWTKIAAWEIEHVSGNDRQNAVFRRYWNTSDPTSWSFGHDGSAAAIVASVNVFRGVHLTSPMDVTPNVAQTGDGTNTGNPTNPSVTTATNGAWVILYHGAGNAEHTAGGAPTNYDLRTTVLGDGRNQFIASREIASAGLETPGAWTHSNGFVGTDYSTITAVLAPAAAAATITANVLNGPFERPARIR